MFTDLDAKAALLEIERLKGKERAQLIERIFRDETAHFKSKQYQLTGSSGMEKGNWTNLDESKLTYITMNDNHPDQVKVKARIFIKWNSVLDAMLYLSDYIDRHDGNFARWNSTDPAKQLAYKKIVDSITNHYIV